MAKKIGKKDYAQLVSGLHPAVSHHAWTYRDIITMSVMSGVDPQTFTGVVTGMMRPHEFIIKAMKKVIPPDEVDNIVNDYNPLRNFVIIDNQRAIFLKRKVRVLDHYAAHMLQKGDALKMDTGDWIVVTDIQKDNKNMVIYSGVSPAFVCSIKDTVVCSPNLVALTRTSPDSSSADNAPEDDSLAHVENAGQRAALLEDIKRNIVNNGKYFMPRSKR